MTRDRLFRWMVMGLVCMGGVAGASTVPGAAQTQCRMPQNAGERPPVCMDAFYEVLEDHGTWIRSDRFGTLFCPDPASFGPDFQPFTKGHWVMSAEGWTFVGKHPMSWVTDHYGRWVQTGLGACRWGWVPGEVYAPAWVEFHVGESVIAWRPARFDGIPVELRVPAGVRLQSVRIEELPPGAVNEEEGLVAVRDKDFAAERLEKVTLRGVDRYAALRETALLGDPRAGLHSQQRADVVAQIPAVRTRRDAAAAAAAAGDAGAPPEPGQRLGRGGKKAVAGTLRTGREGPAVVLPPATPPGAGKVYGPNDPSMGNFTQPGGPGGAKVLQWGGDKKQRRPVQPLPSPSEKAKAAP